MYRAAVFFMVCGVLNIVIVFTSGQTSSPKIAKVTVTAPVSEVEEGGILSIHCQIRNMKKGQEVTILRSTKISDSIVKLSAEESIQIVDSRMFIAKRQLNDGSVVYFLSIIEARLEDEGMYYCKVTEYTEHADTQDVDTGKVQVDILYFPVADPICTPNVQPTIQQGNLAEFNCSAGPANPPVSIHWTVTRTGMIPKFTEKSQNGITYSELNFRPRVSDDGAVYMCSIKSRAFPDTVRTCHIGPIKVLKSSVASEWPDTVYIPPQQDDKPTPTDNLDSSDKDSSMETVDCRKHCKWFSSNVLYWVVSTIVIGIIAFIFFILGLVLIIRYCRLNDSPISRSYNLPPHQAEQIYSELDCKRGEVKQYMALIKHATKTTDVMVPKDRDHGRFEENLSQ